jgi:hypothetical protein
MPETIGFDTFIAVVITEFCFMTLLLGVIIERSIRRAFRHLEEKTALQEQIATMRENAGYCEEHQKDNFVMDCWCEDWSAELEEERKKRDDQSNERSQVLHPPG